MNKANNSFETQDNQQAESRVLDMLRAIDDQINLIAMEMERLGKDLELVLTSPAIQSPATAVPKPMAPTPLLEHLDGILLRLHLRVEGLSQLRSCIVL